MSYRLPLVSTILIAIQMAMGGLIVGKDAGFVCPDWPLCYGHVLPHITPLVALELVHRLSALLVSVFVVVTAIVVWMRHRTDRLMVRLATLSVVSLLLQVVVGGLIVLLTLPGITTTIDVLNSMLLLSMFVALTVLAYRKHRATLGRPVEADPEMSDLKPAAWLLFALGLFAIVVGAVFRHSGASEALFGQMDYLASHKQHTPPTQQMSQGLLMFHGLSAALYGFAMLWFLMQCIRLKRLIKLAILELVLLGSQIALGVWALATKLALWPATLHWSNAALIVSVLALNVAITQFALRRDESDEVRTSIPVTEPNTAN